MSERDLDTLLRAMLDGPLSPDDDAALLEAAASDPDALADYLDLAEIHAILNYESRPATVLPNSDVSPTRSNTPVAPTSAEGVPIYRKGCEPQPFKIRPRHYALLAATLLATCGVAVYLLTATVDPKPDPVDPKQPPTPVATLIHNTGDLRTPYGFAAEGDDYGRGEYTLSSGTAEFMLTNAVNVKLRGKTRVHMRNAMNVALSRGSAEFVCPKDAKGFTVHLAEGVRVIDLGTRFAVHASPNGESEVRVLDGEVEIVSGSHRQRLEVGQRAYVNRQIVRLDQRTVDPHIFADWSFDELAIDAATTEAQRIADGSIHARHASIGGGEATPSVVAGAPSFGGTSALHFDTGPDEVVFRAGSSDGSTPLGEAIRFEAEDSFTVEAIIRTTQTTVGAIVANDWAPHRASWWLRVDNGRARFFVDDATHASVVASDRPINDGQWHHIAAVRDADQRKLRVYVDGQLAGEIDDKTTDAPANTRDIRIGQFNDGNRRFVGDIDHVRLSGRALEADRFIQPLTENEITPTEPETQP